MRNGGGAEYPHHESYSGAHASFSQASPQSFARQSASAHPNLNAHRSPDAARANIARLFFDLRSALRVTPQQLALHLQATPSTLLALEYGDFEHLPVWSETSRVVIAYTALAGIDGRPVLAALADTLRRSANVPMLAAPAPPRDMAPAPSRYTAVASVDVHQVPPVAKQQAPKKAPPVRRFFAAGSALANGAKRLPADALQHVRERPRRALYAVSLPLGIVLLLLNTSALEAAFSNVPRPVARVAQDVRSYFQVQFAPVREGLRWIEVDDPRRRRADKLR